MAAIQGRSFPNIRCGISREEQYSTAGDGKKENLPQKNSQKTVKKQKIYRN